SLGPCLWQFPHRTVGAKSQGGCSACPRKDEGILALEERMAAHASRAASLSGEFVERRNFGTSWVSSRNGVGVCGDRGDDEFGTSVNGSEVDDLRPLGEPNSGHSARASPLRPHRFG